METLASCPPVQVTADNFSVSNEPTQWKEHLRDPYRSWDSLSNTANPNSPVFTHKLPADFPQLYAPCDSHWLKEGMLNIQILEEAPMTRIVPPHLVAMKLHKLQLGDSWKKLRMERILSSLEEGSLTSHEDMAYIVKQCRKQKNVNHAKRIHAYMQKSGLEAHPLLGNHLILLLVDVGNMCDAQYLFDHLTYPNEDSWNALIIGYVKCGDPQQALCLYQRMCQSTSIHLDEHIIVSLIGACAKLKDLKCGQKLHKDASTNGLLLNDGLVGNALVDMYAKCGSFSKAHDVFDKLPSRNVVSWTTLIAGYAEHGQGEKALKCFEQMRQEGVHPNAITFLCSLKACGIAKASDKGRELHEEIAQSGLEKDLVVGSTLVDMYAKCGLLSKSHEVLSQLHGRNVVSWNALIAGYAEYGPGEQALVCFRQMQYDGLSPDAATFVCSLKACVSIGDTDKGRELHAEAARAGFEGDLLVGSTLVDLYAKCGSLIEAHEVFNKLPVRNVVSWTALIAGYAEYGQGREALILFEKMQHEGISPNAVTFVCSLKACGSIGASYQGQDLHAKAISKGLDSHLLVGSALVDMYAKCGLIEKAQEVFDQLPTHNVVTWTALIAGFVESGHGEDALLQLEKMQEEGISPNAATFVCSLKACGNLGFTDRGRELHIDIARKGLEKDPLVGSTLVDMYANCGTMETAQEVFDKLRGQSVISWNVLMAGYGQFGESENLFDTFDKMVGKGVKPNFVTFVNVLNACSHAGLVEKGQSFFEVMSKDFGIVPTVEHQSCMVDLLGRAGQLDNAVGIVKKMQIHPDVLVVWRIILGACQKWGNMELGKEAFLHAVGMDEKGGSAYVCMSNICADYDLQDWSSADESSAWKSFGFSW
ncbi:hypothetical protein GOP47_0014134 [Adiantum capillus-veneris]|uniref:Pentatricopeptide repeat-containing protein n=1 Tax=Adiantum capillus-veneris TaxID=13818 RepID=A0A9D4UR50_ADICA|nr:hypothetical protein GOP47_0014134 [Adiantum capillus-veneris]